MKPSEEFLDIVNDNDVVLGKKTRTEIYATGLKNYRVVNAFIKNAEGKLWIPRRGPNKRIFPLSLDFSMGGHVDSGESYEQAFKREVAEELNLDMNTIEYRELGKLSPHESGVSSFMTVYEITYDGPINYNKNDFVEAYWLTPQELRGRIYDGEKVKSDLPILIEAYYPATK
jgi:isopentenyl-diphosphate delta-isomerase